VWVWSILTFTGLLLFYLVYRIALKITSFRLFPKKVGSVLMLPLTKVYSYLTNSSRYEERTINRVNLIELALRNMVFKKSRAVITVGGMSIGIGAIVFLVSVGYGMQQLVINRVARLDELMQADVSPQPGSRERINDASIAKLKDVEEVSEILPLIASVARVTLNNSVSDVPVYGVTTTYLESSAIKPTSGEIFQSNELAFEAPTATVAGITTTAPEYDQVLYPVKVRLVASSLARIRKEPSKKATLLGYTVAEQPLQAQLVWGRSYPEAEVTEKSVDGDSLSHWLSVSVPLWEEASCDLSKSTCYQGTHQKVLDESGKPVMVEGYIAPIQAVMEPMTSPVIGQVLGESTEEDSDSVTAGLVLAETTDSDADSAWVEIASESSQLSQEKVSSVPLASNAKKVAVVNTAMLKLLGMTEQEAIGKTVQASFIAVGDLIGKDEKVESIPTDYTILGVVPDDKSPYFYVPFVDLRGIGIVNYSQLKVVTTDKEKLPSMRQKIESMGFATRSVADTVQQIDRLFASVRILLGILGMVALSVAALGMFNTLTVSLLERTREVGLMKAMGMKSHEVQELFLTESMVMGFFGGILGIGMGWGAGKMLGVFLSALSLTKGQGFIDISYLPFSFTAFIFLLSLTVGICTGIYPARRATRISALDALRYE
ncbi:ABC transporter permease, partial [Candidatus Woesebacteria bacterium]|nr:ABC transporter permease [Candidatus Woesebacteria bacterium]